MTTALLILLGICLLLLIVAGYPSPATKGKRGEARVRNYSGRYLPESEYAQLHDVTLPTTYGTTQIDHIIISRFGIFVIETKNMSGWIFGNANHAQWTQVLFKSTFKFQNPLRQNQRHIAAVRSTVDVSPGAIFSVIVFSGQSIFKTPMPPNVTDGDSYISYIRSFTDTKLGDHEVRRVVHQLNKARLPPSKETDQRHILNLRSRPQPSPYRKCPKCGSDMVLRTAKKGFRVGDRFWGCSKYPDCKGILNQT